MSNDYYEAPAVPTNYTLARAGEIRQQFAAISAAFDKLPEEGRLREGRVNYTEASGTADALIATLDGSFDTYNDGFFLRLKAAATNTGAATINVNSLGIKAILDRSGNALQAGAIEAGGVAEIVYIGGAFRLLNSGYDVALATAKAAEAAASAGTSISNASAAGASASSAAGSASTATTQAGISTTQAGISTTQAGIATTKAGEAAASATLALQAASAVLRATSASSFTAGNGSKTFHLPADAAFGPGQNVIITSASDPANVYMKGAITAYSPTSDDLTVNVTSNAGSGTGAHTDWVIVLDIGGSVAWGTVTGSLASQTDLQAALDAKAVAGAIGSSALTMATARLLGRTTASAGAVEEISVGIGLTLSGGSLTNSAPMAYPANGIPVASGGAWTTSKAAPTGAILGTTDAQDVSNKTLQSNTIRADNTVTDDGTITAESPGYRGLPRVTDGTHTLEASDEGKLLSLTSTLTIPSNASVPLPIGFACSIFINSSSNKAAQITSDTLRLAGTSSTGTRTMLARGLCALVKVNSTEWVLSGSVS